VACLQSKNSRCSPLVITSIAWLPLLLLATIGPGSAGRLWFLRDVEVHARFLVALPVLIAAELLVHARLASPLSMTTRGPRATGKDGYRFGYSNATFKTLLQSSGQQRCHTSASLTFNKLGEYRHELPRHLRRQTQLLERCRGRS